VESILLVIRYLARFGNIEEILRAKYPNINFVKKNKSRTCFEIKKQDKKNPNYQCEEFNFIEINDYSVSLSEKAMLTMKMNLSNYEKKTQVIK